MREKNRNLFKLYPWKSTTKQRMVFRRIQKKDSLLPMGKVWFLDFLGYHNLLKHYSSETCTNVLVLKRFNTACSHFSACVFGRGFGSSLHVLRGAWERTGFWSSGAMLGLAPRERRKVLESMGPPKPTFLEVFLWPKNLVFRWPKPSFLHGWKGAHGC